MILSLFINYLALKLVFMSFKPLHPKVYYILELEEEPELF